MRWLAALLLCATAGVQADDIDRLHDAAIVIDAHSDFLDRSEIDGSRLTEDPPGAQTTLKKLQQGRVDAQFFSVFVPPAYERYGFARRTFELIDRLYRELEASPGDIRLVTTADGILRESAAGRIAALIGIEGGHSIEHNLALLRVYHRLGVRYMTLTWNNANEWADSSGDEARWDGLNAFGLDVVREMNRLGMMIDISHVSDAAFWDVMEHTRAPVIASHSLARELRGSARNMSDEMIRAMANNGGVIQVSFYAKHLDDEFKTAFDSAMEEAAAQFDALETQYADDPIELDEQSWSLEKRIEQALTPPSTARVADHIDHIVKVAGIDHVGIGSDFDGLGAPPAGLEHIGRIRTLTAELVRRGYTDADVKKILGENLLRVMRAVDQVAQVGS